MKVKEKKYTIEQIEKAFRLFLQNEWNKESEVQAVSPEEEEIIWGGLIGEEITKKWLLVKKLLKRVKSKK